MNNKIKKTALTFFTIFFAAISVATPLAYAQVPTEPPTPRSGEGQGQWWFPRYNDFLDKVNLAPPNEIFGERYTHAQVSWIINSVLNILVGPIAACADEPEGGFGECLINSLSYNQDAGAILPLAMATDTFLQTKPASSVDYVASKMERFGIVNEAYAQDADQAGFGFANSLVIVQELWTITRDAAYSLVILMILVLGFMVMFRAQLSPRTTLTIQSALPRVVIGLLLITFSYAIAGFLVDLTFVAQGIVAGIISTSSLSSLSALDAFQQMNNVTGTTLSFFLSILIAFFFAISAAGGGATGGAGLTYLFSGGQIIAGASIVLLVLMAVVVLIALIRIFWIMLKTYVVVIMLTVVSPFIFLYGIIKDGMTALWLKAMVANLSVFFTVGLMLLMANIILYTTTSTSLFGFESGALDAIFGAIAPNPYEIAIGIVPSEQAILPGFTSLGSTGLIGAVVSLGLYISIPNFAKGIKEWITTGRANFERAGAGEALGAGFIGGVAGAGMKARGILRAPQDLVDDATLSNATRNNPQDILSDDKLRNLARLKKLKDVIRF